MRDIGRTREAATATETIEEYVRRTDDVRAQAAKEYGTTSNKVKRAFNRMLFGGSLAKWKREEGIPETAYSEIVERFEKEMKRARVLIAETEKRRGQVRTRKDATLVSNAVGRTEEQITRKLTAELEKQGWHTGTLIHDAIIIERKDEKTDSHREKAEITRIVQETLEEEMNARGWGAGLARAKVTKT